MRKIIGLLMVVFVSMMVGCNTVNSAQYTGRHLNIAVVGETPTIRENIITFDKVSFSDIEKENLSNQYDAGLL